jgi:hypothetical protein
MERNKGDTQKKAFSVLISEDEALRIRRSLIRLLDGIEVQESDQVQLEDIKVIFKLLEYFSKES